LQKLVYLDVRETKVSAGDLAAFHKVVPGCTMVHDGGTIQPRK
jgi:hypothetical protein